MLGSLGHGRAFGQILKVRLHGFAAWFARRTYYLLQMPGWGRRLRIMTDWTFALLFRPDVVKVSLDTEAVLRLRDAASGAVPEISTPEETPSTGEPTTAVVGDDEPSRPTNSRQ
jgi:NADH dehydrogenase